MKKVKDVESVSIDPEKDEATILVKEGSVVHERALRKAVKKAGFQLASLEKVESETTSPPPLKNEGHQEVPR